MGAGGPSATQRGGGKRVTAASEPNHLSFRTSLSVKYLAAPLGLFRLLRRVGGVLSCRPAPLRLALSDPLATSFFVAYSSWQKLLPPSHAKARSSQSWRTPPLLRPASHRGVAYLVGDVIEDPLAPVSKPTSDEICVKKMHFLMTQLS